MEQLTPPRRRLRKMLTLLLKIGITALCLWWVSQKIDFSSALQALAMAKPAWLIAALLAFILSKFLAALRLNIYFRNINVRLSEPENLRLYLLGMFYNLFLPGSISGDAYKVILLNRRYNAPYKQAAAAVLLDRISGLLALGMLLCFYTTLVISDPSWRFLPAVATLLGGTSLYLVIRLFFRDFVKSYWSTLLAALLVQGSQVLCAWFLMQAVSINADQDAYMFLFLVSSVVAVLPLTVGGLGAREVVFLEGSRYLGLAAENAILISILFYLITLITSAAGAYYVFRDPLKKDPQVSP